MHCTLPFGKSPFESAYPGADVVKVTEGPTSELRDRQNVRQPDRVSRLNRWPQGGAAAGGQRRMACRESTRAEVESILINKAKVGLSLVARIWSANFNLPGGEPSAHVSRFQCHPSTSDGVGAD